MKAWIAALMLLITCTNVAMVDAPGLDGDCPVQITSTEHASVSTATISTSISQNVDHTNCGVNHHCHLGHCGFTTPVVSSTNPFVSQISEHSISTVRLVSAVLQTQKKPPKA